MLSLLVRAAALLAAALPPAPAGTALSIRLKTAVSTRASHPGDAVEAVVIAPAAMSGAKLHGTVEQVAPPSGEAGRASLLLGFTRIEAGGARRAILARVAAVDNAREEVDGKGRIIGILPSESIAGRLDGELSRLGARYSGLAGVLSAARNDILWEASTDISYPPGVELTVRLAEPADLPPAQPAPPAPALAGRAELLLRAASEPFQTVAERPARPSDMTNLLLVGREKALRRAFAEAGWSQAAKLTGSSRLEALLALAEDRGYREAPVSVLLLEGKPPDIVFEKANNTLARRHHLRLWRRPGSFRGLPVWAAAATHDIGIGFSDAERTFFHRIDSRIDLEREKVADDLRFTGRMATCELVERPAVPRRGENATGDAIETDGRIGVMSLR
jgi:hypothetical protein